NSILLASFALSTMMSQAQETTWMSTKDAIAAQKRTTKPIGIDSYTVCWGLCKMMAKNTFSDPKVAKEINDKYIPVKFNEEGNEEIQFNGTLYTNPSYQEARKNSRNAMHQFTAYLRVPGYPTMSVINADGKIVKTIVGYKTPDQLLSEL